MTLKLRIDSVLRRVRFVCHFLLGENFASIKQTRLVNDKFFRPFSAFFPPSAGVFPRLRMQMDGWRSDVSNDPIKKKKEAVFFYLRTVFSPLSIREKVTQTHTTSTVGS